MSLWPFIPTDEFTESIEWVTDVIAAYSAEQRVRLANAPRGRLNFDHMLSPRQYQRARVLMLAGAASSWTVPLWHEKQTVTVSSGATSISVDTTASDYRVGGVAVLWTDAETCEAVTISAKTSSTLTVSAVSRTYTGALVMPGVSARCVGGLEVSRTVDDYVSASVEFSTYANADLASSGMYATTYRGYPVIDDPAVIGNGSVTERIEWDQDTVDNGIAAPFMDTLKSRAAVSAVAAWYTTTLAGLWELRQFLHYLRGKQKAVWVPEWTGGITVAANITSGGTTITITAIGLDANVEAGDLMVQTTAGALHNFRFTSVATSGANEVLTLSAAAGVNITTTNIRRACLLRLCRLDQDRVEIIHRNPLQAQCLAQFTEVPDL